MKPINFLLLLFVLFLFNCTNNSQSSQGNEATDTSVTEETNPNVVLEAVEANFLCRQLSQEDDIYPLFELSIQVSGTSTVLDTVNACGIFTQADYEQYEIPPNALSACGGWYAGAGDYFYAVRNQDELSIIRGWQGEGQEEPGFHYTEVQKIALK